jgi:hypothetical protein
MTPLERSSLSLRSSAGGACPSVSVFGVRSRSDMVGCPHASAIIVAATMPAHIHVSAMLHEPNRTQANAIGLPPDYMAADASRDRLELANEARALGSALDAADSIQAQDGLEKMLVHEMAVLHRGMMKATARCRDH